MKFIILFYLFFSISYSQQNQVCFTVDDLPIVSYGINDSTFQKETVNELIKSLTRNKIPAIGFVNESKLHTDGKLLAFKKQMLTDWVESGLELGNHTFSHPDYNNTAFNTFAEDVIKGETITKEILSACNKKLEYFRHPFLHTGNTKEKSDSLDEFLSMRGYTAAPVTIDNDDYLFAVPFHKAKQKGDTGLANKIGTDYLNYMEKKILFYEKQSNALFGRNINQILLIHASLLNAYYIDSLAAIFRKHNYKFISLTEALQDDLYKTKITKFGKWGISWIDRWALSKGKEKSFFIGDPEPPEYIKPQN